MANIDFKYISVNYFTNVVFDPYLIFHTELINYRHNIYHNLFSLGPNNIKLSSQRTRLLLRGHLNKDQNRNRSPSLSNRPSPNSSTGNIPHTAPPSRKRTPHFAITLRHGTKPNNSPLNPGANDLAKLRNAFLGVTTTNSGSQLI
jgi:hypothetical protein